MVKISTLIIGSKEHLKIIKPYLSQGYFFRDEYDMIYDVGKGKPEKILKFCARKKIEHIIFATTNESTHIVTNRLCNLQGKTYFIPNYAYSEITNVNLLKKAIVPFDINKPCLKYIEIDVVNHCNLKCKGCTHYANIELSPAFLDMNQYTTDLKKLKGLFWNISTIRLLGGEPLLNPMLWAIVDITREFFPLADIRIATNGLLIPKISDELIIHMKNTDAIFDITDYPPTNKMKEDICNKLNTEKISYKYRAPEVTKFFRKITINPINNEMESHNICAESECYNLKAGIISACPQAALAYKFNNVYGTNFPTNCGYLLSDITDGWNLYNQLRRPSPFCRYCIPGEEMFDWEICPRERAKVEDWIVNEDKIGEIKNNSQERKRNSQKHPAVNTFLDGHEKIGKYVRYFIHTIRD